MSVVQPTSNDLETRRVSTGPMALSKFIVYEKAIWQEQTSMLFDARTISHIIISKGRSQLYGQVLNEPN